MKFTFIRTHRLLFSVEKMCQYLKVSRSGYYGWINRPPSKRSKENEQILNVINKIRTNSKKLAYGYPRIHRELKGAGFPLGKNRVARIMKKNGIQSRIRKKWKVTTQSKHSYPLAPNIVNQSFKASQPNELWTSDISYIWRLYLMYFSERLLVGRWKKECRKS